MNKIMWALTHGPDFINLLAQYADAFADLELGILRIILAWKMIKRSFFP